MTGRARGVGWVVSLFLAARLVGGCGDSEEPAGPAGGKGGARGGTDTGGAESGGTHVGGMAGESGGTDTGGVGGANTGGAGGAGGTHTGGVGGAGGGTDVGGAAGASPCTLHAGDQEVNVGETTALSFEALSGVVPSVAAGEGVASLLFDGKESWAVWCHAEGTAIVAVRERSGTCSVEVACSPCEDCPVVELPQGRCEQHEPDESRGFCGEQQLRDVLEATEPGTLSGAGGAASDGGAPPAEVGGAVGEGGADGASGSGGGSGAASDGGAPPAEVGGGVGEGGAGGGSASGGGSGAASCDPVGRWRIAFPRRCSPAGTCNYVGQPPAYALELDAPGQLSVSDDGCELSFLHTEAWEDLSECGVIGYRLDLTLDGDTATGVLLGAEAGFCQGEFRTTAWATRVPD